MKNQVAEDTAQNQGPGDTVQNNDITEASPTAKEDQSSDTDISSPSTQPNSNTQSDTDVNTGSDNDSAEFSTLKEAYDSGKSLKCVINGTYQKSTYYFKDGNIKYSSSVTSGAMTVETDIIVKKDIAYSWTSMSSNISTTADPKVIETLRNSIFQLDVLLKNPNMDIKLVCEQTSISDGLFGKP